MSMTTKLKSMPSKRKANSEQVSRNQEQVTAILKHTRRTLPPLPKHMSMTTARNSAWKHAILIPKQKRELPKQATAILK